MSVIPPGSTIGILGGGQLGRMIASAAADLGYRTHVLAPDRESVAAQTASSLTRADYHNKVVLADFARARDNVHEGQQLCIRNGRAIDLPVARHREEEEQRAEEA